MPNLVTIRHACINDAAGIASVHVNAWHETYTGIIPDSFLQSLSVEKRSTAWTKMLTDRDMNSFFTFVAVYKDEIIGFVDGGMPQQKEHGVQSELAAIYLLKKFQGSGVGRRLFETFLKQIKEANFSDMYLWVLRENPTASFYEKMGGNFLKTTTINIGGKNLEEDMYLWKFQ